MSTPRTILFVDGENLVFRYQALIAAGQKPSPDTIHIPDVFIWHNNVTKWCLLDVMRVYFYTTVVGDEAKIASTNEAIAQVIYEYDYGSEDSHSGTAQIVPVVFKKPAKSQKSRQVDIQITIDMMRFAHNPSVDILYLLSGDGDYIPLLQEVMRHGKVAYVSALSSGLSAPMRYSCDEFYDLDQVFFPPPPQAGRKKQQPA